LLHNDDHMLDLVDARRSRIRAGRSSRNTARITGATRWQAAPGQRRGDDHRGTGQHHHRSPPNPHKTHPGMFSPRKDTNRRFSMREAADRVWGASLSPWPRASRRTTSRSWTCPVRRLLGADVGTTSRHGVPAPTLMDPTRGPTDDWRRAPDDEQTGISQPCHGRNRRETTDTTDYPESDFPGATGSAALLLRHRFRCLAYLSFPAAYSGRQRITIA